jgi:hypothetical protein
MEQRFLRCKRRGSRFFVEVNMNVKTSFNQQYPTAVGKINVQNADLFALGVYKEPFRFRSDIDLQAKDLSPERLNAYVRLDSTIIYQEKRILRVDSLTARGTIDSGKTLLVLHSPFADAGIKGDFKYTELGDVFTNYLAKYSKNPGASTKPVVASFELDANLKPIRSMHCCCPDYSLIRIFMRTGR